MIQLSNKYQKEYDKYMDTHLINGQFIYENELAHPFIDNKFIEAIGSYRLANYSANEAFIEIIQFAFNFFDNRNLDSFKSDQERQLALLLSSTMQTEQTILAMLVCSCYRAYQDILEYELDEDTEMKYLWRY